MVMRTLTGFSALLCACFVLLFVSSWWWMPSIEWEISPSQGLGIESRFGRFTINEIVLLDKGEQTPEPGPRAEPGSAGPADLSASIQQKAQDGEIQVLALKPMPIYSFLLFDHRNYEKELIRPIGYASWRRIQIPYWSIILPTAILPVARYTRARQKRANQTG